MAPGSKGFYHCYDCGNEFSDLQFPVLEEAKYQSRKNRNLLIQQIALLCKIL